MNLALTLVIQGVVFFLVAWAVMKFFWPWLMGAIDERQKKIAEGLAAGSRAQKDLDEAKVKAQEIIREARDKAVQIVRAYLGQYPEMLDKDADEIVEKAMLDAYRKAGETP